MKPHIIYIITILYFNNFFFHQSAYLFLYNLENKYSS